MLYSFLSAYIIFCMRYAIKVKRSYKRVMYMELIFSHLMTVTREELIQKRMTTKDHITFICFILLPLFMDL